MSEKRCRWRNRFAGSLSSIQLFDFVICRHVRETMQMTKSFCWFVVEHPAIWFCHLSTCTREHEDEMCDSRKVCSHICPQQYSTLSFLFLEKRGGWQNRFAGSLSSIQLFDFVICRLVRESMKTRCATAEKYARTYVHSNILLFLSASSRNEADDKIVLLVRCRASSYLILSSVDMSEKRCRWRNRFAGSLSSIQLFDFVICRHVRETMQMTKSFCWFVVEHPAIWFCHLSTCTREHEDEMCDSRKVCSHICPQQYSTLSFLFLEKRGGWQNRFAGSLSSIQLFDFVICRHVRETMQMTKSFCWFVVEHSAIWFCHLSTCPRNDADDKIVLLVRCRVSSYLILSFVDLYERAWRRDVRQQKSMLAHMSTAIFHSFFSLPRETRRMTKSFCWFVVEHSAIWFCHLSTCPRNDADDKIVLLVRCRAFSYLILSSVDMSEKRCRWQNRFAGSLSTIQLSDFGRFNLSHVSVVDVSERFHDAAVPTWSSHAGSSMG